MALCAIFWMSGFRLSIQTSGRIVIQKIYPLIFLWLIIKLTSINELMFFFLQIKII